MNDLRKLAEAAHREPWDYWHISSWEEGEGDQGRMWRPIPYTEYENAELIIAASPDVILGLLDRIAALETALYHVGYSPETDLSVYAKDAEAIARAALENSDLARSSSKVETGVEK